MVLSSSGEEILLLQWSPHFEQVHCVGASEGGHVVLLLPTPCPLPFLCSTGAPLPATLRCHVLPLVVLEIGGELTQVSLLFLLRPFGLPLLASVSACSAELNNRHGHARRRPAPSRVRTSAIEPPRPRAGPAAPQRCPLLAPPPPTAPLPCWRAAVAAPRLPFDRARDSCSGRPPACIVVGC